MQSGTSSTTTAGPLIINIDAGSRSRSSSNGHIANGHASSNYLPLDDDKYKKSRTRPGALPTKKRKKSRGSSGGEGLFASISSSSLVAKLSLGMILWSMVNIFLTGFLVENLSEKDMNELRSEMDSIVDSLAEEETKVVGKVKRYVGKAADIAESQLRGLRTFGIVPPGQIGGGGGKKQSPVSISGSKERDAEDGRGKRSRHHHHALRAADKGERQGSNDNNGADDRRAQKGDSGLGMYPALTPPARRFPLYGTPQFKERCPWTEMVPPLLSKNKIADNCVFLVRPAPKDGEGLAAWAAKIPTEYMMTRQTGCKLKLSYGPGVSVDDVWSTHSDATNDGGDANPPDWTLTPSEEEALGFCRTKDHCFNQAPKTEAHVDGIERALRTGTDTLARAPLYRYAAHGPSAGHELYREDYEALTQTLPGLKLEDAAACAFGHSLTLSPKAEQYEPDLYKTILPTLYREKSLVMAIYTRSLNSDKMADQAARGEKVDESGNLAHVKPSKKLLACAHKIEQKFLSGEKTLADGNGGRVDFDTIVWLVITDSKATKTYMSTEYGEKEVVLENGNGKKVVRKVIATNARGAHTRRRRDPSTADFAEALIDWHLMGESDLIVGTKGFSFQTSAAVRTATAYYEDDTCEEVPLIYERGETADTNKDEGGTSKNIGAPPAPPAPPAAVAPSKYVATDRWDPNTEAYKRECSWTDSPETIRPQCTILVRPNPQEHEGLGMWVSTVSAGYIIARQKGCRFKLSYGDIDFKDIVRPNPFIGADHVDKWKVPSDYQCNIEDKCYEIKSSAGPGLHKIVSVAEEDFPFAEVPVYRHAFTSSTDKIYRDHFKPLTDAMPGLNLETAFACSLSKLFYLSPRIKKFEEKLQSEIFPALRDKNNLVVTVYYRTGHADAKPGEESSANDLEGMEADLEKSIKCAKTVEKNFIDGTLALDRDFTGIVWNVISDSSFVRKDIESKFEGEEISSKKGKKFTRRVITTSSRGAHTKTQANPSVEDFAEGFLDWYLIGESDAVVSHKGWSYGMTGALRTARPVFRPYQSCHTPAALVHEGDGKDDQQPLLGGRVNLKNLQSNALVAVTKTDPPPPPPLNPNSTGKRQDQPKYTATDRFPEPNSEGFNRECSWAGSTNVLDRQCTILVRPNPIEHEGIGMWVCLASAGYIIAKQKGCRFKLSYGDIDLKDIVTPNPSISADHIDEWRVPPDYKCKVEDKCYEIKTKKSGGPEIKRIVSVPTEDFPFANVPFYRHSFKKANQYIYRDHFKPLADAMPGLNLETAFACSVSKLFYLSPRINKFEEKLQSQIFPALRDKNNLVVTVYYRTGHADAKPGEESSAKDIAGMESDLEKSIKCAKTVEKNYIDGIFALDRNFTGIVWNVISDSPFVRRDIETKFGGELLASSKGRTFTRRVITTSSRGAHTKTQANPSVEDFAEGFLDWYLIGESDAVVSHKGWSYGVSGALRTARPIFRPEDGCQSPAVLVHEGDGSQ